MQFPTQLGSLTWSVVLLLAACSSSEDARDTSLEGASPPPALRSTGDTGCVLTGAWRLCSVEDRLERAGLAPRLRADTIRHAFMNVPGQLLLLGDSELQIFLYADSGAMRRDVMRLDTIRVGPPDMMVTWIASPTLITSNNLAAILLGGSERQVERVRNALTAGLPRD